MFDILKERVLKDLNELLKLGVNTKSAIVKVEDGFLTKTYLIGQMTQVVYQREMQQI